MKEFVQNGVLVVAKKATCFDPCNDCHLVTNFHVIPTSLVGKVSYFPPSHCKRWFIYLLDRMLYHSTSKLIDDEEDTLKLFMVVNITSYLFVLRAIVGNWIVVSPTIPSLRRCSYNSNSWPWLWYHLLDGELCHLSNHKSSVLWHLTFRPPAVLFLESL